MRELIGLIGAVDDDAAGALRVIAYFDTLVERGASIGDFVRGAAAQAGCAAGFADRSRGQVVRADAAGRPLDPVPPEQVSTVEVLDDLGAQVWLERVGTPSVVDAMVLERFAAGVRITLERTRDRDRVGPALRVLLDGQAEPEQRRAAADRLGLTGPATVLAAAPLAGGADGLPRGTGRLATRIGRVHAIVRSDLDATAELDGWRIGIGRAADLAHLHESWAQALVALRTTSDGAPGEPGATVVRYADLGGLAVVAEQISAVAAEVADVRALDAVAATHPWALGTLDAVIRHLTVRSAATELHVHHSTLQERIVHLRRELGFDVDSPTGRQRAALALVLRRLRNSGDLIGS